jgi:hypothetical protein
MVGAWIKAGLLLLHRLTMDLDHKEEKVNTEVDPEVDKAREVESAAVDKVELIAS